MIHFILLPLFCALSFAGEGSLDIKTAVAHGLAFSPDVLKAQSQMAQSEDSYHLVEAKFFPTLSLQGLTKSNRNSATFLPGGSNANASGNYNDNYIAQIVATQPLYQGGALTAGLTAAKLIKDIGKQTYFKAKQDYLQSMIGAYFDASQNAQQLEMAKINRELLQKYTAVTKLHTRTGRSRLIDQLQAEANFQLAGAEELRAEADFEKSTEALLKFIGDINLAHAKLETHFDLQPVKLGTLDEALNRAQENNPDIRIARMQVDEQDALNDVNSAPDWPSLVLSGTAGYNSPDQPHLWDTTSQFYSVGLTLTIPFFSGLSSFAQRRVNAEALTQVNKDLQNKNLALRESMADALATVSRNFEQLKLARQAAESARKAMDMALREYSNGLVNSTDVLAIQNTYYSAETQFLTAQFSYLKQVLNLRHDLGVDLERAYATK